MLEPAIAGLITAFYLAGTVSERGTFRSRERARLLHEWEEEKEPEERLFVFRFLQRGTMQRALIDACEVGFVDVLSGMDSRTAIRHGLERHACLRSVLRVLRGLDYGLPWGEVEIQLKESVLHRQAYALLPALKAFCLGESDPAKLGEVLRESARQLEPEPAARFEKRMQLRFFGACCLVVGLLFWADQILIR